MNSAVFCRFNEGMMPSGLSRLTPDRLRQMIIRPQFRLLLICGALVVSFILSFAVWQVGYRQAREQSALRGKADVALAVDWLTAQLQRHKEKVVLLVEHPLLEQLQYPVADAQGRAAGDLLLEAADKTGALALFYADREGRVLASAHQSNMSNIKETEYFKRAMDGALGVSHGISEPLGKRVFYFAAPAFEKSGKVAAALIVAVDIERVEAEWRGGSPTLLFIDEAGSVFISNRSELLFWSRVPEKNQFLDPQGQPAEFSSSKKGDLEIWNLDWGHYIPRQGLHLSVPMPSIGLSGEAIIDLAPAKRLAWLQAAVMATVCLGFGAITLITLDRRHALAQANMVLEERVLARTMALSDSNTSLRHEIKERKEAELALKRAQESLIQAEKLSALGQVSAGISHELNQPLMAIQQYAENAADFIEQNRNAVASDNLTQISSLARRMARIITNLKAFVRNENEPMTRVDCVSVVETALELVQTRREQESVTLIWEKPEKPIWILAGEVRLGQVLINLLTNALDAMSESDSKTLQLDIRVEGQVFITVQDSGPGIAQPEKIFDPFYSTKEVSASDGLGLGLSISYGLIQSFGGEIKGGNTSNGAKFTVALKPFTQTEGADG